MNTIGSIFSIVIIGITFGVMFCLVKQKKLKVLQAFWLALGFWLMIAAIVWLATVLQLYGLKESKNVWDIASMVFTFLGTALTVGTAIAGITALLSYISINDKLKKAEEGLNLAQEKVTKFEELYEKTEQDLNSAQEKVTEFKELHEKTEQDLNSAQKTLTEFQELHQRSMELKQQIENMEKYQVLVQDLDNTKIDDTETNQAAESAAEQILKSDYSQFEHRLKARAILDDIKAREQFHEINQNPSKDKWQQNINAFGEIMALWQLVYQTSNTSNREINQENYACAIFNYGTAYGFASEFHQYDEDKTVYLGLLHQASKQYALALQINPNSFKAANNWGIVLSNTAKALHDTEWAEKRRLWQLALEKFALALRIKPDYYEAANNWCIALNNEANALPDTEWEEKRNLWQSALKKVQDLQSLSDEHQQSSVLQNLVNQIKQQIADLEIEQQIADLEKRNLLS